MENKHTVDTLNGGPVDYGNAKTGEEEVKQHLVYAAAVVVVVVETILWILSPVYSRLTTARRSRYKSHCFPKTE